MRNNIPYRSAAGGGNNPAIAGILLSDRMRTIMAARAGRAQDLYQGIVAHRTGRLAASARVEVFIGGKRGDRWCARMTVGEGITHGAPHEYGFDDGNTRIEAGAHDLTRVLNMLGSA